MQWIYERAALRDLDLELALPRSAARS